MKFLKKNDENLLISKNDFKLLITAHNALKKFRDKMKKKKIYILPTIDDEDCYISDIIDMYTKLETIIKTSQTNYKN